MVRPARRGPDPLGRRPWPGPVHRPSARAGPRRRPARRPPASWARSAIRAAAATGHSPRRAHRGKPAGLTRQPADSPGCSRSCPVATDPRRRPNVALMPAQPHRLRVPVMRPAMTATPGPRGGCGCLDEGSMVRCGGCAGEHGERRQLAVGRKASLRSCRHAGSSSGWAASLLAALRPRMVTVCAAGRLAPWPQPLCPHRRRS
jgi:hypothetical protein